MSLLLLLSLTILAEPSLDTQEHLVLEWDGRELPGTSFANVETICNSGLRTTVNGDDISKQGGRYRWLLQRGRARLYMGKLRDATADFGECVKERPNDATAIFECARVCLMSAKNRDRGRKLSERLQKEFSEPARSAFLAGFHAIYLRSYENAVTRFSEVLSADPRWVLARYYRGVSYYELKRMDEAISDLEAALVWPHATHATEEGIRMMLCSAYSFVGSIERAQAQMLRVYELTPDQKPQALEVLWQICAWRRKAGMCLSLAHQGIRLSPDSPAFYRHAATAYIALGELNKANDYIEMALKRAPFDADNWALAARVRSARGEYLDAAQAFSRAVTWRHGAISIEMDTALRYIFFLATCPDENVRDGKLASQAIEKCWRSTREGTSERQLLSVLKGLTIAELGDTDQGARLISDAIRQRPLESDKLRTLKEVRELLQSGHRYRHVANDPKSRLIEVPILRDWAHDWAGPDFIVALPEFHLFGE